MDELELTALLEQQLSAAKQLRIAEGIQEGSRYMAMDQWIDWVVLCSQLEFT
jgi:flagellar basal body rod protein FlgF